VLNVQAIIFDVNGTLVEIETDEGMDEIFRAIGHLLTYQGIDMRRGEVRELYTRALRDQRRRSPAQHPEFDAVEIWRVILEERSTGFTRGLPEAKRAALPLLLAELYRGVSRRRLRLYPHVRDVLDVLRTRYKLAVVTDAQSAWARAELYQVGLLDYFDPIVVSGDHGHRKPERALFELALNGLGVAAADTLFVGNDMHRDIHGAQEAGMRTVMFDSPQGTKEHLDCVPDQTITDYRQLLELLS
jgi:putative hydrolase of the HAD superfamily